MKTFQHNISYYSTWNNAIISITFNQIFYCQVPVAFEEGLLEDDAVLLQTFLGIATSVGSLSYGLIVLSKNNQCMISRQYLLQSSVFGIGKNP